MIWLRSLGYLALDLLEALLPTDSHDDTMAVADATGVTAPPLDTASPQYHRHAVQAAADAQLATLTPEDAADWWAMKAVDTDA